MRQYITSELNVLAWEISKKINTDWGESFRLAIMVGSVPEDSLYAPDSVLGCWGHANSRNLASHFWSLARAYQEVNDFGRAIAMKGAARYLYRVLDADAKDQMALSAFSAESGISTSIVEETFDYFVAANDFRLTHRSQQLLSRGAKDFQKVLKIPYWSITQGRTDRHNMPPLP